MPTPDHRTARVVATRWVAEDVVAFTLADAGGAELPRWEPGAHLDIRLPSGTTRQYSLCGDPADTSTYRIAVLAVHQGRGGSLEAHSGLLAGRTVQISAPRQTFPMPAGPRIVFVAGGIGITPILPMVHAAQRAGTDWSLHYAVRDRSRLAFAEQLAVLAEGRVTFLVDSEGDTLDIDALLDRAGPTPVVACGPPGLLDALEKASADRGSRDRLHLERFSAAVAEPRDAGTFTVELALSGLEVEVTTQESILEAVRSVGVDVDSSCEQGICGTCETRVLAGRPEHRDSLLTDDERRDGNTMMICVSRCLGDRLSLAL